MTDVGRAHVWCRELDNNDEGGSALGAHGLQVRLLSADSRARSLALGLEGQNLS